MKKVVLFMILVSALSQAGLGQADSTTLTRIGDIAPAFTCSTIDGKAIDISKLKGKVIMINFFATWCGPCNSELPVVQSNIWEKYMNNPEFVLVVIGREHTEKEVSDFVSAKHFTMPFAADPKREIFKLYATQNIPRNVIIGKDGRIIFQGTGYTKAEFRKIEELLAERLKSQAPSLSKK
jgi:peroxiredoxin